MIRYASFLLLALFSAYSVATAGIYGILTGQVLDAQRRPVAGAMVLVNGTKRGAYTKPNGKFTIVKLLAGSYTIVVKSIGFNDYSTSITIAADQTEEIKVSLKQDTKTTDTLVVFANKNVVDPTVIGSVRSATADGITRIPTESIQGVIAKQAGVLPAGNGFNIRGGCIRETQFRIDGLDINDQFSGAFGEVPSTYFPTISNKDIQDVQVLTGGPTVEYSNALSGVVAELQQYKAPLFTFAEKDKLSTFAMDVDNASYTLARSTVHAGQLPPPYVIRTEEFLNYFNYGYAPPCEDEFAVYMECAPSVFGKKNTKLLSIGIKAREMYNDERRDATLTFVIDISGSMADELDRVQAAMTELVRHLRPTDNVCIVTFGSEAAIHLATTSVAEKDIIIKSIQAIHTTGSTNVGAGMKLGYECAAASFDDSTINRVILIGDGVANNGLTRGDEILETVAENAKRGISITVVGMGMGKYNDELMEELANKGNGKYYYIDSEREMKRLFVDAQTGILEDVARDAKIQVEFDPLVVEQYRLLGYENRHIPDSLFRDDKQDAGEVGPGHTVIALYELVVRPQAEGIVAKASIRYRIGETSAIREIQQVLATQDIISNYDSTSYAFRLASVVAQYAELLRGYAAPEHTFATLLPHAEFVKRMSGDAPEVCELKNLITKAYAFDSQNLAHSK